MSFLLLFYTFIAIDIGANGRLYESNTLESSFGSV